MGSVIISLDCEGLWGLADHIGSLERTITTETLTWAYKSLLESLDRHELAATFAFVALFASSPDEQRAELELLRDSAGHRAWISQAERDLASGRSSGWELCESLDWVQRYGRHEVGSHSFTHLPLGRTPHHDPLMNVEIAGVARWAERTGVNPRTYVFPRNQVVSLPPGGHSIIAYRDTANAGGRIKRTIGQCSPLWPSQSHPASTRKPIAIPGGELLNWRRGPKRAIPARVTRTRWRSILSDAAKRDRVAHLWLHPHNLITGSRQFELLDKVLADTSVYVRDQRLRNETQLEYALRTMGAE